MAETKPHARKPPGDPTRQWKRIAAAALLLLTGGAIVNVTVAWGCAALINPFVTQPTVTSTMHSPTLQHIESRLRRFGHTRIDRAHLVVKRHEQAEEVSSISFTGPFQALSDQITGELNALAWQSGDADNFSEDRAGWPMRCLTGFNYSEVIIKPGDVWMSVSRTGRGGYVDAIELSPFFGSAFGTTWRALPLRPIWPGFIINALFYALLLWLLIFTPFAARRALRRKRRLCEKCAYPIGVSPVCTECGAAVPRMAQSAYDPKCEMGQ